MTTMKEVYEDGMRELTNMGHDVLQLPKVEFDQYGDIVYSESEEDFLARCERERK